MRGLSLRTKLFLLLILLPLLSLGLYLALAVDLFRKDKVAYVFDAEANRTRSLAAQVNAEVQIYAVETRAILGAYDPARAGWDPAKLPSAGSNEAARLRALTLYAKRADETNYRPVATYPPSAVTVTATEPTSVAAAAPTPGAIVLDQNAPMANGATSSVVEASPEFLARAVSNEVALRYLPNESDPARGSVRFARRLPVTSDGIERVAVAEIRADAALRSFAPALGAAQAGGGAYFLVGKDGSILLASAAPGGGDSKSLAEWPYFKALQASGFLEGASEAQLPNGMATGLVAVAPVGLADLEVVGWQDREVAFAASNELVRRSVLFLIMILSVGTLVSYFAARTMTSALRKIYFAMEEVGKGNLTAELRVDSTDEVGVLAQGFRRMAGEVSRLLVENVEKARMEKELETGRAVQETLFPASHFRTERLEVAGHFRPASECGGDFWYYAEVGGKMLVWVGDATGHGVPAALVTSAARAGASLTERLGIHSPAVILKHLSDVILDTSKGQMYMTLFVALIDPVNETITYANAGHVVPYLIRRSAPGQPLQKGNLKPLGGDPSLRLGTIDTANEGYREYTADLRSGDQILFYTDGLNELASPTGEEWGRRRFLQAILAAFDANDASASDSMDALVREAEVFRAGASLVDDVTALAIRFQ